MLANVDEAKSMTGSGADRYPLQEKMSGAWAAFARSGNPNHKGLPNWPAFKTDQRATMMFDNQCKVVNDPHGEERLALASLRAVTEGARFSMRYYSSLFIAALAGAFVLQAADNPLSTELKQNYEQRKNALLAEADRMADADYSFKATPDVGTFGSRVAHVADAQIMICSAVKGETKKPETAGKTSRPISWPP